MPGSVNAAYGEDDDPCQTCGKTLPGVANSVARCIADAVFGVHIGDAGRKGPDAAYMSAIGGLN